MLLFPMIVKKLKIKKGCKVSLTNKKNDDIYIAIHFYRFVMVLMTVRINTPLMKKVNVAQK